MSLWKGKAAYINITGEEVADRSNWARSHHSYTSNPSTLPVLLQPGLSGGDRRHSQGPGSFDARIRRVEACGDGGGRK